MGLLFQKLCWHIVLTPKHVYRARLTFIGSVHAIYRFELRHKQLECCIQIIYS